jgi:hypothetical protein
VDSVVKENPGRRKLHWRAVGDRGVHRSNRERFHYEEEKSAFVVTATASSQVDAQETQDNEQYDCNAMSRFIGTFASKLLN